MTPIELLSRYLGKSNTRLIVEPHERNDDALFSFRPYSPFIRTFPISLAELNRNFPASIEVISSIKYRMLNDRSLLTHIFEDPDENSLTAYFLLQDRECSLALPIATIAGERILDFHERLISAIVLNANAVGRKASYNELHFPEILCSHVQDYHLDDASTRQTEHLPFVKEPEPLVVCICGNDKNKFLDALRQLRI